MSDEESETEDFLMPEEDDDEDGLDDDKQSDDGFQSSCENEEEAPDGDKSDQDEEEEEAQGTSTLFKSSKDDPVSETTAVVKPRRGRPPKENKAQRGSRKGPALPPGYAKVLKETEAVVQEHRTQLMAFYAAKRWAQRERDEEELGEATDEEGVERDDGSDLMEIEEGNKKKQKTKATKSEIETTQAHSNWGEYVRMGATFGEAQWPAQHNADSEEAQAAIAVNREPLYRVSVERIFAKVAVLPFQCLTDVYQDPQTFYSNPAPEGLCCMHCTLPLEGRTPLPLPIKRLRQRRGSEAFIVEGQYCTFACVLAASRKSRSQKSPMLLRYIIKKIYGLPMSQEISPAPDFRLLSKFGGPLEPEEFRVICETPGVTVGEPSRMPMIPVASACVRTERVKVRVVSEEPVTADAVVATLQMAVKRHATTSSHQIKRRMPQLYQSTAAANTAVTARARPAQGRRLSMKEQMEISKARLARERTFVESGTRAARAARAVPVKKRQATLHDFLSS